MNVVSNLDKERIIETFYDSRVFSEKYNERIPKCIVSGLKQFLRLKIMDTWNDSCLY